jgi:hypothetical protein
VSYRSTPPCWLRVGSGRNEASMVVFLLLMMEVGSRWELPNTMKPSRVRLDLMLSGWVLASTPYASQAH